MEKYYVIDHKYRVFNICHDLHEAKQFIQDKICKENNFIDGISISVDPDTEKLIVDRFLLIKGEMIGMKVYATIDIGNK